MHDIKGTPFFFQKMNTLYDRTLDPLCTFAKFSQKEMIVRPPPFRGASGPPPHGAFSKASIAAATAAATAATAAATAAERAAAIEAADKQRALHLTHPTAKLKLDTFAAFNLTPDDIVAVHHIVSESALHCTIFKATDRATGRERLFKVLEKKQVDPPLIERVYPALSEANVLCAGALHDCADYLVLCMPMATPVKKPLSLPMRRACLAAMLRCAAILEAHDVLCIDFKLNNVVSHLGHVKCIDVLESLCAADSETFLSTMKIFCYVNGHPEKLSSRALATFTPHLMLYSIAYSLLNMVFDKDGLLPGGQRIDARYPHVSNKRYQKSLIGFHALMGFILPSVGFCAAEQGLLNGIFFSGVQKARRIAFLNNPQKVCEHYLTMFQQPASAYTHHFDRTRRGANDREYYCGSIA